jgi:hypothetical protein
MQNIPQVANNATQINNAEFVKITVFNDYANTANVNVYALSSSYKNETISGTAYSAVGGLLGVGAQNRNLRVTQGDTNITISGIDSNNIGLVLDSKVRGSEVEVIRGFYDANFILTNTYPRFTGIITSYALEQDRINDIDNYTITLSASSYKTVLENRIAGRKTNKESWRFFNPSDASMDNVYAISGVQFDFGQDPKGKNVVPGSGSVGGSAGDEFNEFIRYESY